MDECVAIKLIKTCFRKILCLESAFSAKSPTVCSDAVMLTGTFVAGATGIAVSVKLAAMPAASATSVPVNITASEQTVGDFALKGAFQAKELTETGLYEQQDGEFVKVGSLGIDPFRAYLKDNGGSAAETIVINCDGVLVTITNQDDSTVTLYGLKKVEFLKENNVPSVRVTYADNSTATYNNPKKVEFGK